MDRRQSRMKQATIINKVKRKKQSVDEIPPRFGDIFFCLNKKKSRSTLKNKKKTSRASPHLSSSSIQSDLPLSRASSSPSETNQIQSKNNTGKFTDFGRRLLLPQDTHRRLPLPYGGTFLREPQAVAARKKKKENMVAATCQGWSSDDVKKKSSLQFSLLLSRRRPPALSLTSEKGGLLHYK
ncbi:unnamed protein product [Linum trigynum]|uniref:Uncharacterized protein n=1 Tax=Linum trigynum TaxID=586398 RepID=A0AAV2FUJ2_9ROSI